MRLLFSFFFIFILANVAYSATQEVSFNKGNLSLSGKFPFNANQPLEINGHDKKGKPFTLVITSKNQTKNIYQFTYKLTYSGEKSSGSVVTEIGKPGVVETGFEDHSKMSSKFSINVAK